MDQFGDWRDGFSARHLQHEGNNGPELIEVVVNGREFQLYRNEFEHLKAALAAVA